MKKSMYSLDAFLLFLLIIPFHVFSQAVVRPSCLEATSTLASRFPSLTSTSGVMSSLANDVNLFADPYDQDEPTIAVNPSNPLDLAASSQDASVAKPSGTTLWTLTYHSSDAGATWSRSYVPHAGPLALFARTENPVVDFDGFGTAFCAGIALMRGGTYDASVWVSRSRDGGLNYENAVIADEGRGYFGISFFEFNNKPWITVDKRTTGQGAGYIYVTWTSFIDINGDGVEDTYHVLFSRSTDGGSTFSTPLQVSDSENWANQFSQFAVGPNGEAYVSWINWNLPKPRILIDKSTDYGVSFATDIEVQSFNPIPKLQYISRTPNRLSMAVGTSSGLYNGHIYVVYSVDPLSSLDYSDVVLTRSVDGGNTWDTPIKLNDDTTSNDQFSPVVIVDPSGNIKAAWYDRRLDISNRYIDVFLTSSNDGGSSFITNTRITDTSFDPAGVFSEDYIDIDASATQVHPIWTDRRNGNNDVYTEYAPQGHELSVWLEAPTILEIGDSAKLNATVNNIGSSNETNVELRLLINGTLFDSTLIPELLIGSSYTLEQLWTPIVEEIYNVTAYAPPLVDEVFTSNNAASKSVQVAALPDILVVADDDASHYVKGTSLSEFRNALVNSGYNYWEWKESAMGRPSLGFLLKFKLVIWTSGDYWSWAVDPVDSETLEAYFNRGRSILLEGEDIGYDHGSDSLMLNVAHATYQIDCTEAFGLTITDPTHPVTQNLPQDFLWLSTPLSEDGVTPTQGGFEVIRYTSTTWTAVTVFDGTGTNNGSVVYYAFPVYSLEQLERDKLIINSVNWLHPKVHDVAVINVTPSKTILGKGHTMTINVTVKNQGDYTENFTVTTYGNTSVIGTQTVNNLLNHTRATITFTWNTTDYACGNYTVSAYAIPVLGETDTADNTLGYAGGMILVTIPGDLNGNGIVDVLDLYVLSRAYGSTSTSNSWNSNCDLDLDNAVNALDLQKSAKNFGKSI